MSSVPAAFSPTIPIQTPAIMPRLPSSEPTMPSTSSGHSMKSSAHLYNFDRLAFVKYAKNIGRAYRNQTLELISICQNFVRTQEQTPESYAKLRNALELVDDALQCAAAAGTKTSKEAGEKFRKATETLSDYEMDCHSRHPVSDGDDSDTVGRKMEVARAKDKSSSTILNRLKESLRQTEPEPTTTVEFLLHKSLPDTSPIIVKQVLRKSPTLEEILWNFSRFKDPKKRLTLSQNPHFYAWLPSSPEEYGGKFRTYPIESSLHVSDVRIHVLTDNPDSTGRIFLETTQDKRVFGNIWIPDRAIIFKDVCGKLEGERIIGEAIEDTTNLRYFEEPLQFPTLRPASSPNQNSSSPTTNETPKKSVTWVPILDWREPIRRRLRILKGGGNVDTNIRITTKPPGTVGPSDSAPSSPIQLALSNSTDGSLLPIVFPPSQLPPLQLQIPGPSGPRGGTPTPSIYGTAQNTPVSERSQVVELSQSIPTSPPHGQHRPRYPMRGTKSQATLHGQVLCLQ